MKKILTTLSIVLLASAMLLSCKKDKEDEPNYFKVGETTYDLTATKGWCYDVAGGIQRFDLILTKSLTDWDNDTPTPSVNLYNVYCATQNRELKSGTYALSDTYGNMTHDGYSDYMIRADDWDWVEMGETISIKVQNHGNSLCEFWWEGKDENNVATKGHYKGTVNFIYGDDE